MEKNLVNNFEEKEILKDLRTQISKYNGKYNTKEFKEYLEALLMLDIDILKDNTYNEKQIEELKRIEILKRLISFNIYGSIRNTLNKIDSEIVWPGKTYNEDVTYYTAWKNRKEILSLQLSNPIIKNEKAIISLNLLEKNEKIRREQIDNIIEKIYKKSINKPEKELMQKYHYFELAGMICPLHEMISRTEMSEEQIKYKKYLNELYKEIEKEYGPFAEETSFENDEKIKVDVQTITGTTEIKKTPVAVFKKIKTYY